MELRHLRYFIAVAEELHFRRAAEKLHIVQPALSKQISSLEHELGILLLNRDRRHVSLTEAGQAFFREAIEVVAQADGAMRRALAVSKGEVGRLNIGFIHPALAELLPHTIRRLRNNYPDIMLTMTETYSRTSIERILNRSMDVSFIRMPVEDRSEYSYEIVSEEPVMLIVPGDHRLATSETVTMEDIAGENLMLISRHLEPKLYDYYIAACNDAGFSPRISHEVNSTAVAIGLVAGGLGVTFAPESSRTAARHNVVYRELTGSNLKLTMGIIWHSERRLAVVDNFLRLRPWGPAMLPQQLET